MRIKLFNLTLIFGLLFNVSVFASCDLTQIKDLEKKKDGAVRLFARSGSFEAAVLEKSKDCATNDIILDLAQSQNIEYFDFVTKMKLAPARYTAYLSENDTIGILQYEGLAAPMDYYLQSNNISFPEEQMLKLGGRHTIAVAYSKNTKQIYANNDILNSKNKSVPTTYEELLSLAEELKSSGVEYPVSGMFNNSRDLAIMFVNIYLSLGGELFKDIDSPKIAIRNKTGIKTLEMMKSVIDFSNPEHLSADTNSIEKNWSQGNSAIGFFWASQFNNLNSDNTSIHSALSLEGGSTPASSIWFKGFTVARYVVESEAVAAMQTMKYSLDNLSSNTNFELWLDGNLNNNPAASVLNSHIDAGVPDYPVSQYVSLLTESIGLAIVEYILEGGKPKSILKQMEKDYTNLAKELEYR